MVIIGIFGIVVVEIDVENRIGSRKKILILKKS
jgi:hypothetical protein